MAGYRPPMRREKGYLTKQIDEELPGCVQRFKDVSTLYKITFFLLPFSVFIETVGVFIPWWLDVKVMKFDTVKKEYHQGLWQKCYPEKCKYRSDIYDFEFAVRAMCMIAVLCSVATLVLIFLSICIKRTAERTIIHVANMICCFVSCGMALLSLFIYAGAVKPTRAYFLSYGYYLTMLGALLMGICGVFVVIEIGMRIRNNRIPSGFHPRLPPEFEDDNYKDREDEFREDSRKGTSDRHSVDDEGPRFDRDFDRGFEKDMPRDEFTDSKHSLTNTEV